MESLKDFLIGSLIFVEPERVASRKRQESYWYTRTFSPIDSITFQNSRSRAAISAQGRERSGSQASFRDETARSPNRRGLDLRLGCVRDGYRSVTKSKPRPPRDRRPPAVSGSRRRLFISAPRSTGYVDDAEPTDQTKLQRPTDKAKSSHRFMENSVRDHETKRSVRSYIFLWQVVFEMILYVVRRLTGLQWWSSW